MAEGCPAPAIYDHLDQVETDPARSRAKVTIHVRAAVELGRSTYGVRRVHHILTGSAQAIQTSLRLR